jgi:Family of unknown function (DUF6325)
MSTVGPIEIVVLAFPGNKFNGRIMPELTALVEAGTVRIVDGMLGLKDAEGACTFLEFSELPTDEEISHVTDLFDQMEPLISDEDLEELMADLEPNSTAAMLVFEHTWVTPLRDAIVESGGILAANIRIPADVVADVLSAIADMPDDE